MNSSRCASRFGSFTQRVPDHSIVWSRPYPGESQTHFERRVAKTYRDMPEAFHLYRIKWQVIGHLTFRRTTVTERVRNDMFTAALRQVCKRYAIYFPKVQWALRHEIGTRKDISPHLHFLIAAFPGRIDIKEFCLRFESQWLERGGGLSKVLQFSRELDGAGYIAKLSHSDGHETGNNCGLMFSEAALKKLKRLCNMEKEASSTRTRQFRAA